MDIEQYSFLTSNRCGTSHACQAIYSFTLCAKTRIAISDLLP